MLTHCTGVRLSLLSSLVLMASACGTGPDGVAIAGTWAGVAQLPSSLATTLTLTQSGNTIGGNIEIVSELNRAFLGTWDASARTIEWLVFDGCEKWSGTFTITADGSQMSGPVLNDTSACPGSDLSGTISVSKQ